MRPFEEKHLIKVFEDVTIYALYFLNLRRMLREEITEVIFKFLIIVVYFLYFFIYRSSKFRVFASIQKINLLLKLDWLLV